MGCGKGRAESDALRAPKLLLFILVCLAILPTRAESAEKTIALLIGVSSYSSDIGLSSLRGPANDVRLLRDVLSARGVSDIRILADGVEGSLSPAPTRDSIMQAFQQLARDAGDNTLVMITMSGHGTQQRDKNGDEADGRDEVFLPSDTARAEPGSGIIPNAIIDDEIGAAISAIRRKGADVWLVVDSCHSGSALRAGGTRTATRFADPKSLGVSFSRDEKTPSVTSNDPFVGSDDSLPGGLLAFYAAQSDELAREVDFSDQEAEVSGSNTPAWYGLFTSKLAARLRNTGAASYRQLFQAVLDDMNDAALPGAARLQTPLWSGTMIDATVLGGRGTALTQYAVSGDLVEAGRLHGLVPGTVLSLVNDATDEPSASRGSAQVEQASAATSFIRPVAETCIADAKSLCDRLGQLPDGARFARPIAQPVDLTITLSPPGNLPDDIRQALETSIHRVGRDAFSFGEDWTVQLVYAREKLWFGRRAAIGDEPLGLSWSLDEGQAALTVALERILHAERLSVTLDALADDDPFFSDNPVEIETELLSAKLGLGRDGEGAARECARLVKMRAFHTTQDLPEAARLKQCDILRIKARGTYAGARDVNRIHVDATFCVWASYERIEGTRRAVPVGKQFQFCSDCPSGPSAGDEKLYLVITEARPNADQFNLKLAVENCRNSSGGTTRGNAAPLSRLLSDFRRSTMMKTRGSFGGSVGADDVWVERKRWTILPRSLATIEN